MIMFPETKASVTVLSFNYSFLWVIHLVRYRHNKILVKVDYAELLASDIQHHLQYTLW